MTGLSITSGWSVIAEEAWAGVADWRAAHPQATFSEIEREVDQRLDRLRSRMLQDVALASAVSDMATVRDGERPACPSCGGRLEAHGKHKREVQTMRGDAVSLRRSYTVCQSCKTGVFPPR